MNKTISIKLILISFLLLCSILNLPQNISAAQEETKSAKINLSEEELAYRNRVGEITIGCPIQGSPVLFHNDETGDLEGITIDILDMISEETGLTFHYEALPSGSISYADLKRLKINIVAGVELNEINKHAKNIAMTDAYLHAEKVFVCKKGVVFQPDNKMVIAVASGSETLARVIKQQYPNFEISFYDSTEDALSALRSDKADAVLQNQYTMERILCKPIYENLHIVATASIGDSHCLASLVPSDKDGNQLISEDTSLLLSILNKGIAHLDMEQISFLIIKETAENTYRFTIWDMLYRYRYPTSFLFISLLLILFLLRRNRILKRKHSEQIVAEQRAKELADINARMKEQQYLLKDALKRAEEGNRAKSTFLFNMSHDIRTPMNAILGFTEIARSNMDDTSKLTDCIDKIELSGKHLLHLINNVLDMARIESGNVPLEEERCNLEECVHKVRDVLQAEIDKKQLTFRSDMSSVKNKWVYCDIILVDQILFNLINNSVKFSKPGGSILLSIHQNSCPIREYAAFEIRVKDTGIGMPPEFLSHIFEPFERANTSTVSHTDGIGLGLSITKNLVDLMGGTIEVSSKPDQGSEFVLQLTLKLHEEEQPEQQPSTEPETEIETDFSGKRLLLVEDNELNMEIAQELLSGAGFTVENAQNGQIAVEMVKNSTAGYYDAVLMDIQMPVMNGYEASREIRHLKTKELAEIPIIALTANTSDEDKKKAMSYGMNAYIAKPIDIRLLYSTLQTVLEQGE